jgi:hypothetical protein
MPLKTPNPYRRHGIFEEKDSNYLFGREKLLQGLLTRLNSRDIIGHFIALGSGKSNFLNAGLIPALARGAIPGSESGAVTFLSLRPQPWDSLKAILGQDNRSTIGTQHVLIIDQFEDIFRASDDTRAHLQESLYSAVTPPDSSLCLMPSVPSDFCDQLLLEQDFGELMPKQTEFVRPPLPEELEQIIVGTAQRMGVFVGPGQHSPDRYYRRTGCFAPFSGNSSRPV